MRSLAGVLALFLGACSSCKPGQPPPDGPERDAASSAAPARADGVFYTFSFGHGLERLEAEVCFHGPRPEKLIAPTDEATRLLRGVSGPRGDVTPDGGDIPLAGVGDGECLRYRVDTAAAFTSRESRRVGPDAILSPDVWFWGPDEAHAALPMRARFELPPGLREAVPWPPSDGERIYRVPQSLLRYRSQAAFVTRPPSTLALPGAELTVVEAGAGFGERRAAVDGWLAASAGAVSALLGGFPLARAQVLLVAEPDREESFGYAVRGGGATATLLMAERPDDAALARDWTGVHELFHFSHPPMGQSESWLFEGVATYLTSVARARSGLTSRRYGWWELLDGFERGSQVGTGVSLREECAAMHDNRTYWRVYWSGAFMALAIDVELRRRGRDLPTLWAELGKSGLDETRRWSGEELVAKLATRCRCDAPTRIVAAHLDATSFPDTRALAAALGVRLAPGQSVDYDDDAPDRAIRQAIMAGD
jgi:hypothetical protein